MTDLAIRENPKSLWDSPGLWIGLGLAAATTALIISARRKPPPPPPRLPGWSGTVPVGKGIYVYDLDDAPTPENMAERLAWLDMDWVLLQTHRIQNGQLLYTDTSAKRHAYIAAIRARGIAVGFWGWPEPSKANQFADVAVQMIQEHNPSGFVVNAEKGWASSQNKNGPAAAAMMAKIRGALGPGRGLGFTSFGGGPPYHPKFPWREFLMYADFGSPQIYDMYNQYPENYPPFAVQAWSQISRAVIPVWPAGPSKSPAGMVDIQNRTPLTNGAACWWSLGLAVESAGRSEVIRSTSLQRNAAVA